MGALTLTALAEGIRTSQEEHTAAPSKDPEPEPELEPEAEPGGVPTIPPAAREPCSPPHAQDPTPEGPRQVSGTDRGRGDGLGGGGLKKGEAGDRHGG